MMDAIINSAMSNMIESGISKRWRLEQSVAACFQMVTRRHFPQRACCARPAAMWSGFDWKPEHPFIACHSELKMPMKFKFVRR